MMANYRTEFGQIAECSVIASSKTDSSFSAVTAAITVVFRLEFLEFFANLDM